MSVIATYHLRLEASETIDVGEDLNADPITTHSITDALMKAELKAGTTVPVTKPWSDKVVLSGGVATLDLRALVRPTLPNANFDGLKVQLQAWFCPETNSDPVTIKVGATNPYHIFGDANGEHTLDPGEGIVIQCPDKRPDVSVTAKDIDLSSAMANAEVQVVLVAG